MIKVGIKERDMTIEAKLEVKSLVPQIEKLGKVSDFTKAKEYNVPDSVSSLHS